MQDAHTQLEQLRSEIRRHDRLYYLEASPEISDLEYDRLLERLRELEAKHPELVTPDSPTQRVGEEVTGELQSVEHRIPMLSIDNTYSLDELRSYLTRSQKSVGDQPIQWVLELKIDGVAASLVYEQGVLVRAVTRGNGLVGEDVTHTMRTVVDVPLRLSGATPDVLEVRGEVYMKNSDLAKLNLQRSQAGLKPFANTRNVTAGTIRLQDPREAAERRTHFFAHGVGYCEGLTAENHIDFLHKLRELGLPVTPHVRLFDSADQVLAEIDQIQAELHELDFEVDGLVLKVNDFQQRSLLGSTTKSPRWMAAYKIEKYEAITRLNEIRVQVGKSGQLTPVAELEPVQLAGTTVSRASLHNAEEIQRKDIRVGDWVVVEKAGKIIPHVVRVELHRRDPASTAYQFPTQCPECGAPVEQDAGGVMIRCTNPHCPAKLSQKLRFFASRAGMDIDGLGEKVADQLVEAGLVEDFADLFRLDQEKLMRLDKFGARKAERLLQGIEASKSRGLARVLSSVSIRHVGQRVGQLLAQRFPSYETLAAADVESLAAIDEIGEIIANSVYDFVHSDYGRQVFSSLQQVGVRLDEPRQESSETSPDASRLAGKTFVVTGTLTKYTRTEIKQLIEDLGGRAASAVSASTDYLVAGEKAGSKLDKAHSLGVPVLSEDDFEALIQSFQTDSLAGTQGDSDVAPAASSSEN